MNVLVWIVIFGVVAYVFNFGGFQGTVNNLFGKSTSAPADESPLSNADSCPTDGTSTLTLNVQDELTPTATNVDVEYFVFNGNKLVKEGTTGSDGTVDIDVACGKDYEFLILNTTTSTGSYAKIVPVKARISEDTVNVQVIRFGNAQIVGIQNPGDPSKLSNVTLNAGATVSFDLLFKANFTDRGFNKPIIMCEALISNVTDITISSFSDGTPVKSLAALPKRVTPSSGEQFYAWVYDGMLTPKVGIITTRGSITGATGAAACATCDMSCRILDTAPWKTSDYKIAGSISEGFPESSENTQDLSNVGGPDTPVSSYTFVNAGGY